MRACVVCGRPIPVGSRRRLYCQPYCAAEGAAENAFLRRQLDRQIRRANDLLMMEIKGYLTPLPGMPTPPERDQP